MQVNRTSILGLFVLVLSISSLLSLVESPVTPPSLITLQSTSSSSVDYVVTIVMENHGLNEIIGKKSPAPYMNNTLTNFALATNYTAVTHPSLPNYLALFAGSTFGCAGVDSNPNSDPCTRTAWHSKNLVDNLESKGLTWKGYMENMPSNCYAKDSGSSPSTYIAHHNPFIYFSDIATNPARCANVVPAGTNDASLINDLASPATAPNFMWLTPNGCNDMHNCSVSTGDAYLANLVPRILSSPVFTKQKAALFITFDEGNQNWPNDYVYAVWAGPTVMRNYRSTVRYDHYSFLKTLETFWDLSPISSGDIQAKPMLEFFAFDRPQASFNYIPNSPITNQTVTFTAVATGGVPPLTYLWTFNGTQSTVGPAVGHVFTRAGSYNVSLSATDGANKVGRAWRIILVTDHPLSLTPSFSFIPTDPVIGENVTFSSHVTGGVYPYVYRWTLGDNSTASDSYIHHAYNSPGSHNVTLTVVDIRGNSNSTSKFVNVTEAPTFSSIINYSPSKPMAGQNITFTATTSGGEQPYIYRWNLGDGTQTDGSTAYHAYARTGTFNVTLTTTDNESRTSTASLRIAVETPTVVKAPSCWYCVWNLVPWPLSYLLIGIASAALLLTGLIFFRLRIRRP